MSQLQSSIRKNDNVLVITGKDRGKRGRVLLVVPAKNVKGGIVSREASLHASNVQLVCPECGAMTRVGRKVLDDGRKVRICRKCEGVVDK